MRSGFADVGEVRLHYLEQGEGPLVVLLHGFPEFSFGWRRQLPLLAAAGYRVVAPDLRGYGASDRPERLSAYRMEALVGDVVGLIRALGSPATALVGHDWGGVIAWYVGMHHPEVMERLVVMNAPHPAAFGREMLRSTQLFRSWYAGFFQIPALPERVLGARDHTILRSALRGGPARDSADEEVYVEAFRPPGALKAAISYYRAAARLPSPGVRPIARPTLLLWGERDRYLVRGLTEGLEGWVTDLTVERWPDATHWLHHEHPERVAEALTGFFARQAVSRGGELR